MKYIICPLTEKKILIHSRMGKNILKKYVKKLIGGSNSNESDDSNVSFETAVGPEENEIYANNIRLIKGIQNLEPKIECRLTKKGVNDKDIKTDNCNKQWNSRILVKHLNTSIVKKMIKDGIVDLKNGLISNCRLVRTNDKRKDYCISIKKIKCFFEDMENFDEIIDFFSNLNITNEIESEKVIQNVRNYKKNGIKLLKKFEKTFKDSYYQELKQEFENNSDNIVIINYTTTRGDQGTILINKNFTNSELKQKLENKIGSGTVKSILIGKNNISIVNENNLNDVFISEDNFQDFENKTEFNIIVSTEDEGNLP